MWVDLFTCIMSSMRTWANWCVGNSAVSPHMKTDLQLIFLKNWKSESWLKETLGLISLGHYFILFFILLGCSNNLDKTFQSKWCWGSRCSEVAKQSHQEAWGKIIFLNTCIANIDTWTWLIMGHLLLLADVRNCVNLFQCHCRMIRWSLISHCF